MRHIGMLAALTATLTIGCADKDTTSGTDSGGTTAACDTPATWYADTDGDGFGTDDDTVEACDAPDGFTDDATDCDDSDDTVNPDADELCDDVDNDCNDAVDDDPLDPVATYTDQDGDGYGDPDTEVLGCDVPSDSVKNDRDCDDNDSGVFPGAEETCDFVDQDCDDQIDEDADGATEYHPDDDGDGYGADDTSAWACDEPPEGYTLDAQDCDDSDAGVNPDGQETCDGVADEDCDGTVDEADAIDTTTFYADQDNDGFGDPTVSTDACSAPSGYGVDDTDCDDSDATEYPGASWYADLDSDTYGDPNSENSCERAAGTDVATNDDCNDSDATVYPSAAELCDGQLNDCLGSGVPSDESDGDGDGYVSCTADPGGFDAPGLVGGDDCDDTDATEYPGLTWYADSDGDGYGDASSSSDCTRSAASDVLESTDCDDADGGVYPSAVETCDSVDQDCDGDIDEDTTSVYYVDDDGDGYGTPSGTTEACSLPSGHATNSDDCDDSDSGISPAGVEVCDGSTDEDCDGSVDEGVTTTYYLDFDSDGYGSSSSTTAACTLPSGYATTGTDCDDTASGTNPGATEVCDGSTDEDCDGGIDEGVETTYYLDADTDGYGDPGTSTASCSAPAAYVTDATDCDDGDTDINPGAAERCDSEDTDCDPGTGEDALATWVSGVTGKKTDVTSSLTPAGAATVATYTMASAGQLWVCDGTWDAALVINNDVEVIGLSGDRDAVVLDGQLTDRPVTIDKNGVSVTLQDLTLTNGYATDDQLGLGSTSGGALACDGMGTTVTVDNVVIQDSYGYFGGAVSGSECALDFIDSELSGSSAYYGGALFLDGTDVRMTDTTVSDNVSSYYGGGIYFYDQVGPGTLDMSDSLFTGNDAGSNYGGAIYASAYSNTIDLVCAGSSGVSAGFTDNTAGYDGGALLLTGPEFSFKASSCDFGTTAGGDLNDPDGISIEYATSYQPGDDASFSCDTDGCGSPATYYFGDYSTGTYTTTGVAYWNIIQADTSATLHTFSPYLYVSSGSCTIEHYVMSASSTSGTWDYEWRGTETYSSGTGYVYFESDEIGVAVEDGRYYALVTAADCGYSLTMYYGYSSGYGTDAGFGTLVGGRIDTGYTYSSYTSGESAFSMSTLTLFSLSSVTEL